VVQEGEVPRVFIPAWATEQPQTCKQKKSGDCVVNPVIQDNGLKSCDHTYPDLPEGSERGHRPSRSRGGRERALASRP
jgi:hypothetical protein